MKKLIAIAASIALMFGLVASNSERAQANQSANSITEADHSTGVDQNSNAQNVFPVAIDTSDNSPASPESTESPTSSDSPVPSDPSEFPVSPEPVEFPSSSEPSESPKSLADPDYVVIELDSLPTSVDLTGEDPEAIAIALFGNTEPTEGNFQQQIASQVVNDEAIVIITQTGLPDDSMRGLLYRLEFTKQDEQTWQLVWVGRQQTCYEGRGAQEWTKDLCS